MKKILAVSGGIDSVVMLHMFRDNPDAIVAHFDHGIRSNSCDDCDFVERLANSYRLPFFAKHAKLGANCSEETARKARYDYLRQLAKEQNGQIYTAHHRDDLVETVIINYLRGTGWRGLAPLNNVDIVRPLINMTKKDIYRYAAEHDLHFREDQTNSDEAYLRNRVRFALQTVPESDRTKIAELAFRQRELAAEIDSILAETGSNANHPRAFFQQNDPVSLEYLRYILGQQGISLTRPQLNRAIDAICTYAPGKKYSLDKNYFLKVNKYYFQIEI